jgi:hypothetical protein
VGLDIDAVAIELAAAVTAAAITLNGVKVTATDFVPDALTPPHFAPAEFDNTFHRSFGGRDEWLVTCRLFVSRSDDAEGQRTARQVASSTGSASIRAAIEATRGGAGGLALNGKADDLVVRSVRGPRLYQVGESNFYGVEFVVFVTG